MIWHQIKKVRLALDKAERSVRQARIKRHALKMNLPVPALAESSIDMSQRTSSETAIVPSIQDGEARENDHPHAKGRLAANQTARGGQKFDKKAYQRELMRKRRAKEPK